MWEQSMRGARPRHAAARVTSRLARRLAPAAALLLAGSGCAPKRTAIPAPLAETAATESRPSDADREHSRSTTGAGCLVDEQEAETVLCQLYERLDSDCDRRLTVLDEQAWQAEGVAPEPLQFRRCRIAIADVQQAAQAATELADGLLGSKSTFALSRIGLPPRVYLARRIEGRYWRGLTRSLDPQQPGFFAALRDEKVGDGAYRVNSLCPATPRCKGPAPSTKRSEPVSARVPFLYVPADDPEARHPYTELVAAGQLRLSAVPPRASAEWLDELTRTRAHGPLTMAYDGAGQPLPFVVPGGRFNEMYGWDSYFIVWGLLTRVSAASREAEWIERLHLAQAMVEHHAYQIAHYGKVLNANRTYYLTRSQPPFFASMARLVASALSSANQSARGGLPPHVWLRQMLSVAEQEYTRVWSAAPRRSPLCDREVCLARYYGEGTGQPPEVEPGHFALAYQQFAVRDGHCPADDGTDEGGARLVRCAARLAEAYQSGKLEAPNLDAFFVHDRCVRESGHDTTFRWFAEEQERCADHVSVDLNSLLFRYELELARNYFEIGTDQAKQAAMGYCQRASARQRLIQRYLWDERRGMFFDYDFVRKRRTGYVSATTLYPLWASIPNPCDVTLVSAAQARRLVPAALGELEAAGGLRSTSPVSLERVAAPTLLTLDGTRVERTTQPRQWESPTGWAPHQMLAWVGLQNHGFGPDARRLAGKWVSMIASNAANYHGTVPEKFDVEARSHRVFAEYGNVNTDFSYIAEEGFGWMNASFVVGYELLEAR